MIEIQDVSKQFDCVTALRHLTLKVQDGSVFGLVGSNGAGKSTLLRILAGVYRPDSGRVLINGQAPFENEQVKRSTVFISDYPYLAPTATVRRLARLYRSVYPGWSEDDLDRLKLGITRVQFALADPADFETVRAGLNLLKCSQQGKLFEMTVRGTETETLALVQRLHPLFCETLPITLEELFISEMEVAGYDINKVI